MIITQAAAKAMVDAFAALPDAGASAGYIEIRTGTAPATPETAATGTLLGTLTLSDPAFGAATTANPSVATLGTVTGDTSADATGTATWARVYDSDNNACMDLTVGTASADLIMSTTSITSGYPIDITSGSLSLGTGA